MMLFSFLRKNWKKIAFHTISCMLIGALVAVAYTAYQYKQMTQKWYAPIEEKTEIARRPLLLCRLGIFWQVQSR